MGTHPSFNRNAFDIITKKIQIPSRQRPIQMIDLSNIDLREMRVRFVRFEAEQRFISRVLCGYDFLVQLEYHLSRTGTEQYLNDKAKACVKEIHELAKDIIYAHGMNNTRFVSKVDSHIGLPTNIGSVLRTKKNLAIENYRNELLKFLMMASDLEQLEQDWKDVVHVMFAIVQDIKKVFTP